MSATLFLIVLIAGLALGNVFLSVTDPKRLQKQLVANPGLMTQNGPETGFGNEKEFFQAPGTELSFEGNLTREKAAYLAKRIDRLEQLLLKINDSKFVAQKLNGTNLVQKLNDLDEFKQNTRLEIAALKQRLDKLLPEEQRARDKGPEISDEKLREIVFRASH